MPVDVAEITADAPLAVGTVIGGKYRIVALDDAPQASATCSAVHEGTGRRVWLRIVRDAADADEIARMARAARAAGSAAHGGVLGVIDSGTCGHGRLYVVYEHFEAEPASALVARVGPLPVTSAADVVYQIARALGALHQRGVVHRAIRPEHVLIAEVAGAPRAKLTGFELALVPPRFADAPALPRRFSRFAAPESRRDPHDAGSAADVFALGVLLRFLITGSDAPSDDLPAGALRVVERATADEPDARYAQVDQLAAALVLLLPERARAGSVAPTDPLISDLRYLQKLAASESIDARAPTDAASLWRRTALGVVEVVYARVGRAAWASVVESVPDIERILPRSGEPVLRDERVSSLLVTRLLEAADANLRAPHDPELAAVPGLGADMSARGLRRLFPAYPAQLTLPAWLDSLPLLYAALFAEGTAEVAGRTLHEARLLVRGQGGPSLALHALFAGLLRAELVRLCDDGAVRLVASSALGEASDTYELHFG